MRIFESLHSDFKRSIVVVRAVVDVKKKKGVETCSKKKLDNILNLIAL